VYRMAHACERKDQGVTVALHLGEPGSDKRIWYLLS
jgi:hypothetical protein